MRAIIRIHLFLTALYCAVIGVATATEVPRKSNILWISAEDTTLEYGCYGDRYALTPNIDALAKSGLRFSNCFAEAPMCAPSRFTLITGLHTARMGTTPMHSQHRIPDYVKGFPTYLRAAGYYCSNNSKTDYNTSAEPRIINESWDESSPKAHWRNRKPGQPFFAVFNYMDTHQSRASQWPYDDFVRSVQSRLKTEQIHDPAKAPMPPYYPDTPIARRTVARYYDCIATLDDFVKERLDELKEDGVADDTIVVFFADNGAGIPRAKLAPFENGVREPLIIWLPEKYQHLASAGPGTLLNELVCFADFAPTMLSLAGLEIPAHMQGRAFLGPRATAPPPFVTGIRDRVDESQEVTRWLNDGRFHYIRSYRSDVAFDQQTLISPYNAGLAFQAGRGWVTTKDGGELCREIRALKAAGKLNEIQNQYWSESRPTETLYDGENDPWSLHNLAGIPEHQERLKKMRQQLRSQILEQRDLGFWPEPEQAEAEKKGTAFDEARKGGVFPFERILETAELVGAGVNALPQMRQRLKDADSSVRYWAAVGLHALRLEGRAALNDLDVAMTDPSPSVRIEASCAVAELGGSDAALSLLVKELDNSNEWAACAAANALERLGEKARPYRAAMENALERRQDVNSAFGKDMNCAFAFSLITAIENLTSTKAGSQSRP